MTEPHSVGAIVGHLRLDRSDWNAGVRETERDAARLGRLSPNIRINDNSREVASRLGVVGTAAKKAENDAAGLRASLLTLAPAAVPIGAAAAAAGAGFVGMGATAALAIKGISAEMKAGTAEGHAYTQSVTSAKDVLAALEKTAAAGVLAPVQASVKDLNDNLPMLNRLVTEQSRVLGVVAQHGVSGLLGGAKDLQPAFTQVDATVERLAGRFDAWANGPSGAKFGRTLATDFAQVEPVIEEVVVAVGKLLAASNGTGLSIVHAIGVMAQVIDSFPQPALEAIVEGVVAFRAASAAAGAVNTMTAALGRFKTAAAGGAAVSAGAFAGGLGVATVGIYSLAKSISNITDAGFNQWLDGINGALTTAAEDQRAWTDALDANKGALTDQIRLQIAGQLQQNGLADAAAKAGIGLNELTDGVTGNSQALFDLVTRWGSVRKLTAAQYILLTQLNGGFATSTKNAKDLATTQAQLAAAQTVGSGATKALAADLKAQSDATGDLVSKLQALAQTQIAAAQSEDQLREGLLGVNKQVKDNGDSLSKNTKGGLANRDMLLSLFQGAVSLANAQQKNHKSIDSVTSSLEANVEQIRRTAINAGLSSEAVDAMIKKLGLTPAQVMTKFVVDAKPGAQTVHDMQAMIDRIRQGKVPGIKVDTSEANALITQLTNRINDLTIYSGGTQSQVGAGGGRGVTTPTKHNKATGGIIRGPGTGTSDTAGLYALSNGEAVIPARAVAAHPEVVKALIAAGRGLAAGGTVGSDSDVYRVGSGYGFQGSYYGKAKDADAARLDALHAAAAQKIYDKTPGSDAYKQAQQDARDAAKQAAEERKALVAAAHSLNATADTSTATASQVRDAAVQLKSAAHDAGLSAKQMATISTLTKHLSSGAAQRDRVRDQLGTAPSAPSAYDRLAAAQAAYGSLRDSTRSAVTGAFDITSAGGSIAAIIAQQAHALGGAQKFDTALEDLRKRGLSKDQVEAFAAKGPGALAQVLAIDKGSNAQIAQLNQQDAALAKVGDKLGSSIAQAYEGAGLKSAQSLVSGLKAKEKELSDLMDRLGDRIANKIANAAGTEKGVTRKGDGGRRQVVVRVGNHHSTHAVAKSVAAEVMRQLNQ
jgi:hypothetical protein